jgi:deazaflavin-dependent oxidoreductase (nitroreductase family)
MAKPTLMAAPVEQPAPPRGLFGWLFKLPAYLYRAHLGFLFGHRFLVLVHEGRRTHRRYETPLEVLHYDRSRREAIVAAGWGQKTSWLHNVKAGLAREVRIANERFVPAWRQLEIEEAVAVFECYERRSGIPGSVVRGVLSRLLGWAYDGTPEARRRAAHQLPLLAFRPATFGTEPKTEAAYL